MLWGREAIRHGLVESSQPEHWLPIQRSRRLAEFFSENFEKRTFPNAIGSDDCDPVAFTNIE